MEFTVSIYIIDSTGQENTILIKCYTFQLGVTRMLYFLNSIDIYLFNIVKIRKQAQLGNFFLLGKLAN